MLERQLFQGLVKAGGFFLLVKFIYGLSLGFVNHLIYQGYQPYNWLIQELAALFMGVMLLSGSLIITRYAYQQDPGKLTLPSLFRVGVKIFGLWLIFQQISLMLSMVDYWRFSLEMPQAVGSIGSGYWAAQAAIIAAAIAVGMVCIRFQSQQFDPYSENSCHG